jgi:hypothetical protein
VIIHVAYMKCVYDEYDNACWEHSNGVFGILGMAGAFIVLQPCMVWLSVVRRMEVEFLFWAVELDITFVGNMKERNAREQ